MKRQWCVVVVLTWSVTILTAGCTPQPQPAPDTRAADEAAIREADMAWSKTAEAKQVDAMIGYYAADAMVLAPNEPLASGKEAVSKLITGMFAMPGFSVSWQSAKVEVARSGDLGYSQGTFQMAMNDPKGNPMTDRGKYITVWRKQGDGTWKVVVDMINTDMPAAPPPK